MLGRLLLGVLCLWTASGCGSDTSVLETGAQTGTPPPTQAEVGQIQVVHSFDPNEEIDSRISVEAGVFRFQATDAAGQVIYGPVDFPRAPGTLLSEVPTRIARLRVDYTRADGKVLEYAEVPVNVQAGQTTQLALSGTQIKSKFYIQLVNDSGLSDDEVYVLVSSNNDVLAPEGVRGIPVLDIYRTQRPNGTKVESVKLSTVPKATQAGQVITTTTQTGRVREVREFSCDHLQSAVFFVSYRQPMAYTSVLPKPAASPSPGSSPLPTPPPTASPLGAWAAPTEDVPIRFEKFEASCDKFENTFFTNLSTIDLYGIPLQAERLDSQTGRAVDVRTFYTSTKTFMAEAYRLAGKSDEIFLTTDPAPSPGASPAQPYKFNEVGQEPQANFARVVSPKTFTQQATNRGNLRGLPAPYPGMEGYLRKLVADKSVVRVQGLEHGCTYDYSGKFTYDDVRKTFDVEMTGTMTVAQPSIYNERVFVPLARKFTLHLPLAQHPPVNAKDGEEITSLDNYILAAPLGHYTFDLDLSDLSPADEGRLRTGLAKYQAGAEYSPGMTTHDLVPLPSPSPGSSPAASPAATPQRQFTAGSDGLRLAINQSPYINVYGDVMVGLMRGYVGGVYTDSTSADWFQKEGHFRSLPPFASARPSPDDGNYYGWCALAYRDSDSYGHPFDDRDGRPPVPMNFQPPDTLRITVLADNRLDAPAPKATVTGSSLSVSWPAVAGASQYAVAVTPLDEDFSTTVEGTSVTLDTTTLGLSPGTPYDVSVRAVAGEATSAARAVRIVTPGTAPSLDVPTDGGRLEWEQQVQLVRGFDITVNGQPLRVINSDLGQLSIGGQAGPNRYVATVKDSKTGEVVFTAGFQVDLEAASKPQEVGFEFSSVPADAKWFRVVRAALLGSKAQPRVLLPNDGKNPVPPPFSWPRATIKVGTSDFNTGLDLFTELTPLPERVVGNITLPSPLPSPSP